MENQIRLTEGPFGLGPAQLRQRIAAIGIDRTRIYPVNHLLHVGLAEYPAIDELAYMAVDLTRRHALGHQHFADHW